VAFQKIFVKLILCIIFFTLCAMRCNANEEKYTGLKDFEEVLAIVHKQYVDKVDDKKLIENAINGMLGSLDPYSTFLNKEEYEDIKLTTRGEFGGIGAELNMEQGFAKVVSSYRGWPAYKAGIKSGDIIVMIDDEQIGAISLNQVADKLKGEPGSQIKLKIYREPGEIKEFVVTREVIKLTPVKTAFYAHDKVIYAKIGIFNDKTSIILKNELQAIMDANTDIRGLVLDLRDNPGGVLDQAVDVSRLFLTEGKNIVLLRTRHNQEEVIYSADGNDITKNISMVVLINHGSASASEIVAGAMQDNQRALIMGEKSFCKGLVQNIIPFSNGSAIKLTTAKFYTPLGRSIQEECIVPDIEVADISNRGAHGSGSQVNNLRDFVSKKPNASDVNHDYPLQRAIDLVKGISLYKGHK
jgi:carboxyl-terminal processing protease